MLDKFTARARKVILLAREEATRLHHDMVGTEHILLGLVREGDGGRRATPETTGARIQCSWTDRVYKRDVSKVETRGPDVSKIGADFDVFKGCVDIIDMLTPQKPKQFDVQV